MPQTRECDYCGSGIEPGTGVMFVRTNGTTIHYCSSKCEANDDLGREPRDVEWTDEGQRTEDGEEDVSEEAAEDDSEADDEAEDDESAAADEETDEEDDEE